MRTFLVVSPSPSPSVRYSSHESGKRYPVNIKFVDDDNLDKRASIRKQEHETDDGQEEEEEEDEMRKRSKSERRKRDTKLKELITKHSWHLRAQQRQAPRMIHDSEALEKMGLTPKKIHGKMEHEYETHEDEFETHEDEFEIHEDKYDTHKGTSETHGRLRGTRGGQQSRTVPDASSRRHSVLRVSKEMIDFVLQFGEVRRHKTEERPIAKSLFSVEEHVKHLFSQKMKMVGTATGEDQLVKPSLPEVAFIGRSNVGKSSLINAITGRNVMKTSTRPGETQQIVFYRIG